MKDVNGN